MAEQNQQAKVQEQSGMILALAYYAIAGCAVFGISILIADSIVPEHDWIADTISDLGAGKYEFVVDIGLYAYAASLISIALLCAHVHLGGTYWSVGTVGFALLGLIVFLVGARNEYGDSDSEGVVIHIYLVYALGVLMTVLPLALAGGAARAAAIYQKLLLGYAVLWTVSAPFFFFMPDSVDGIYERYLGLISVATVITLAWMFISRERSRSAPSSN
ncbi:DUF998 domain-containing protein [Sulfitobacter sp. F26169L]|uniref:DUF998 domain-containing protein n=1 Tax=Sulfitobacter sp. F26169L TaxID=2996015 RepID=UPI002260A3DF|nr:DUF998 domain-containing protein [Sulfitobacter sp. F26169L]MCX7564970.1 DUF998 domain-containing protein [Sulfitobacter sp. F26169L]